MLTDNSTERERHFTFPCLKADLDRSSAFFHCFVNSCKQPLDAFSDPSIFAVHTLCYLEYTENFSESMELHIS